tara:strand:+ start:403 stop:996 length:594 start_codon:yes stop_codon:yes gene_type:complete
MKLNKSITLQKPPETDPKGKRVEHPSFTTDSVSPIYNIHTKSRYITVYFEPMDDGNRIEGTLVLVNSDEYSEEGDYSPNDLDIKLLAHLGEDPQRALQDLFPKTVEQDPDGPGAILTNMIKSIGIVSSSSCSCRRHAIEMNEKGSDWCEENMSTILSWLKDESKKRNLPFVEAVAKMIVNRAINKSRKLKSANAVTA